MIFTSIANINSLRLVLRISFWWIAFDILLGRYSEIATTKTAKFSHVPCAVLAKPHNICRCILQKITQIITIILFCEDDGTNDDDGNEDENAAVDDDDVNWWQVWGGVETCVTSRHWLSDCCLLHKMHNTQSVYCTKVSIMLKCNQLSECALHNAQSVYCTKCISIHPMLKHIDLVWKQNAEVSNAHLQWLSECLRNRMRTTMI